MSKDTNRIKEEKKYESEPKKTILYELLKTESLEESKTRDRTEEEQRILELYGAVFVKWRKKDQGKKMTAKKFQEYQNLFAEIEQDLKTGLFYLHNDDNDDPSKYRDPSRHVGKFWFKWISEHTNDIKDEIQEE